MLKGLTMSQDNVQHDPNDHWVVMGHTTDRMEAESIAALLRSENIPVFLKQEGAGQAIGITVGILGMIDIMVPSKLEKLAVSLLDKRHHFDSPFGG